MTKRWMGFPIVALAFSLAGCGPDCAQLCEDLKECSDAAEDVDCEKSCEEDEKKAEEAGCESQYEEALSCLDDQDDVCKAGEACEAEQKALLECVEK